ncbi:MAG TPA: LysR family transcriptional regulator ArgP [Actinocrinis sp.]|jgi:LysR family transcriptional regulator (chromosome initiation inhibitor)
MIDLPLDQVRTLLAAVDEGTFEAAARALQVTPSAVSQRIKALEQHTGRVLLIRSKPVRLTESGLVVVRFARQLDWLERDASAALGLAAADGPALLAIAVNADSLATWFLPALGRLTDSRICFEIQREDQDHTARLLSQGSVMAAVTSTPQPVQGCSVRGLGRMRYRAMASPAFAARHLSDGPVRRSLAAAPVVVFDRKDDLQDRFMRDLAAGAATTKTKLKPKTKPSPRARAAADVDVDVDVEAAATPATAAKRHFVPSSEGFVDAVVMGLGWGMVPEDQAATRPAGALVDIAPDRPIDVPLYWQQWKLDSPALTTVADIVGEAAAAALRPA